ncbi:MAG: SpoIID/LytB domain-containing protein [Bacteroidales bacterium]|nr:SpoIID/LytB domain-containing protein [Bacteroidales bacterium]
MLTSFRSCILVFLTLSAFTVNSLAGDIRIGLLSLDRPFSLTINISGGEYKMLAGGNCVNLKKYDNILIVRAGNQVLATTASGNTLVADSISLIAGGSESYCSVRNNLREGSPGKYYGHLTVMSDIGALLAVNTVDVEHYLAGVVQAEAGFKGNPEYFKTQAMLARTYLYMNIDRHMRDGYNLCDKIHCQAYHGRSEVEVIHEAVKATSGRVLANADSFLVFAPFHSNCGGQTQSSENVWLAAMQHLSGVIDPYCGFSRNAHWKKEISVAEWIAYLGEHGYRHQDTNDLVFKQWSRKRDYIAADFSFPLIKIREDWELRSTFFSLSLDNDSVIIDGRGYGHGVGLCQEGTMVMSERGFKMEEIIGFYFRGLKILDIKDVKPSVEISTAF